MCFNIRNLFIPDGNFTKIPLHKKFTKKIHKTSAFSTEKNRDRYNVTLSLPEIISIIERSQIYPKLSYSRVDETVRF